MNDLVPAVPTRDEMLAAIGPDTRVPELVARFGISDHRIRRLMRRYEIPPFPPGLSKGRTPRQDGLDPTRPPGVPLPRERTRLDDLCDQAAADYQDRAATKLATMGSQLDRPAPDPIGHRLGDKWATRALCKGLDPETFIPKPVKSEAKRRDLTPRDLPDPKRICAVCPVRDVCPHSKAPKAAEPAAA